MASGFQLPTVCTQVIREITEALLPLYRDSAGVIDDGALTLAVIKTVRDEHANIAYMIEQSSVPVLAATTVGTFLRTSKSAYVIHHNDHKGLERKQAIKSKQRMFVTYIDAAGLTIKKDRHMLTKEELLKVINFYEARKQGDQDVIDWCVAAYQQMVLLGLGDDAVVGEVLQDAA